MPDGTEAVACVALAEIGTHGVLNALDPEQYPAAELVAVGQV
jgi:hypothetical protein